MGRLPDASRPLRSQDRDMSTSTDPTESFQISIEAAEFYESAFVPAFFAQWAPIACEAVGLASDQTVLDVACGTGILARTAAEQVGPHSRVVGLDLNEAMLTVARRVRPDIEWHRGDAAALPFADKSFDAVLCQMALMFFPDRAAALREMHRVVADGGRLAVVVPARLEVQPAFAPFAAMAARHAGRQALSLLNAYFVCGDLGELTGLVESTGLRTTTARALLGRYRAPSVDAFVTTEVESTPLGGLIGAEVYERIRADARDVLRPFTAADGAVDAPFECNIVAACRR